jgi:hypothetical protein
MPIVGSFAGASARAYGLGAGVLALGDFESIATVIVSGGSVASVTFSDIPQTFTHLHIRAIARHTNADTDNNIYIRFNADTTTNYSNHNVAGSGSSAIAGGAATVYPPYNFRVPGASSSANIFGVGVADILDYSNTNKFKTVRSLTGHDQNGSGTAFLISNNWRSTAAITSIVFFGAGFNITEPSHFALYGVKA